MIESIPHNQLKPSPLNPRKGFNESKLAELADSIAEKGVLQNLVARKKGKGFEIAAGERRWRAVQLLIDQSKVPADYALPVRIQKLSDLELVMLATTENVNRQDMHPLEEAEAFAKMVELGADVESIALRMGMSVATVKKRLTLAGALSNEAKTALREDRISLSQAQALTLASARLQDQIIAENNDLPAKYIKDMIAKSNLTVANAIFPLEQYTGVIVQDLYSTDDKASYFEDQEQAKRLQLAAIDQRKKRLEQSWKWVEVVTERWLSLYHYDHSDDPDESGVIIHVHPESLEVKNHEGLVRPGDVRKQQSSQEDEPVDRPNRQREDFENGALSRALQSELSKDFRLCIILSLMAHMGTTGLGSIEHSSFDERYSVPRFVGLFGELQAALRDTEHPYRNNVQYPYIAHAYNRDGAEQLFTYLNSLSDARLHELFCAYTVTQLYTHDIVNQSLHGLLIEHIRLNMREHFRADESYLKLLRKNEIVEVAAAVGVELNANDKKGDLVSQLAARLELLNYLPENLPVYAETEPLCERCGEPGDIQRGLCADCELAVMTGGKRGKQLAGGALS
jgi:ParB/RepB/Spo0J family partition protein